MAQRNTTTRIRSLKKRSARLRRGKRKRQLSIPAEQEPISPRHRREEYSNANKRAKKNIRADKRKYIDG